MSTEHDRIMRRYTYNNVFMLITSLENAMKLSNPLRVFSRRNKRLISKCRAALTEFWKQGYANMSTIEYADEYADAFADHTAKVNRLRTRIDDIIERACARYMEHYHELQQLLAD